MNNDKDKLIRAIFSDYDGTLCSASAARDMSLGQNRIPLEIKKVLQEIAEQIPICIISSKDYSFLKETRAFARVISCLMGIETLSFAGNSSGAEEEHQSIPPIRRRLMWKEKKESDLFAQSNAIEEIAERIETEPDFRSIIVERKYTYDRRILSGITVDWRYSNDWDYYRRSVRHYISALITNLSHQPVPMHLYLHKYDFHPFVDVYVAECNKGIAFDLTLSEISTAVVHNSEEQNNDDKNSRNNNGIRSIRAEDVLYLGDSENDNPAFRKAGVSIGVRSDSRINPKLECPHTINFDRLAKFLQKLKDNHLRFREEQLIN
jgi:hydroxymethylpyrimidine pyrophosphatase-like HAD family hydrolase